MTIACLWFLLPGNNVFRWRSMKVFAGQKFHCCLQWAAAIFIRSQSSKLLRPHDFLVFIIPQNNYSIEYDDFITFHGAYCLKSSYHVTHLLFLVLKICLHPKCIFLVTKTASVNLAPCHPFPLKSTDVNIDLTS